LKEIIATEFDNEDTDFKKNTILGAKAGFKLNEHWPTIVPHEHYLYDQMIIQYT